ncbi:hypothetical protein LINPERPRIM_LOCUS3714 [Linum perenne]
MDQRGICNRLYNFIIKSLSTQAFKTVTLGSTPCHFDSEPRTESRADICGGKSDASVGFDVKLEEEVKGVKPASSSLASLLAGEARGTLKKSVSINERVQEMDGGKSKKLRRKGSSEKINPFEEDERPLRSILKVGSMSFGRE